MESYLKYLIDFTLVRSSKYKKIMYPSVDVVISVIMKRKQCLMVKNDWVLIADVGLSFCCLICLQSRSSKSHVAVYIGFNSSWMLIFNDSF